MCYQKTALTPLLFFLISNTVTFPEIEIGRSVARRKIRNNQIRIEEAFETDHKKQCWSCTFTARSKYGRIRERYKKKFTKWLRSFSRTEDVRHSHLQTTSFTVYEVLYATHNAQSRSSTIQLLYREICRQYTMFRSRL